MGVMLSAAGSLRWYRDTLGQPEQQAAAAAGRDVYELLTESAEGKPLRRGFDREAVLKVMREKGRLGLEDFLRLRVRYFADGAILGTRGFVDSIFGGLKGRFGAKRKEGARRVRGLTGELCRRRRSLRRRWRRP